MRRFTFAAGNLKKLATAPLYGFGALLALLVRRNPRSWVFGSGTGYGEGALVLARYAASQPDAPNITWLAGNDQELALARGDGFHAIKRTSLAGLLATTRAGVIVVTHGFGDVNRYGASGALTVFLWHGIPHKKLRLDSPEAMRVPIFGRIPLVRRGLRKAFVRASKNIGMFTVAGRVSAGRIRSAFALNPAQLALTGEPRVNSLHAKDPDVARADARQKLGQLVGQQFDDHTNLLLFAPTWRDGREDPLVPTTSQWRKISSLLEEQDGALFIRSHPLGAANYAEAGRYSERIHLLPGSLQHDINDVLHGFDCLVTDYSSIAFDYALTGGAIHFLAPDAADYARRRGTYEPHNEFAGDNSHSHWGSLIAALAHTKLGRVRGERNEHAAYLARRFHENADGAATARVYAEILRRQRRGATDLASAPGRHDDPVTVKAIRVLSDGATPTLVLDGFGAAARLSLESGRLALEAEAQHEADAWSATIPLVAALPGEEPLPIPSGEYRLRVWYPKPIYSQEVDPRIDPRIDPNIGSNASPVTGPATYIQLPTELPKEALVSNWFRIAFQGGETLTVRISAPLTAGEVGPANQARLEKSYRRAAHPLTDAVFFESFYGQACSDNPLALSRQLAALRPETIRYWAVTDNSVPVPEGAVRVVEGSKAWWLARETSKLLVFNDWMRKRYRPRAGQHVLQTWHGTPLKRMSLDRPGLRLRSRIAAIRESRRWDVMLSQNPHSTKTFRSAFAYKGPILEVGQPRNDVLAHATRSIDTERTSAAAAIAGAVTDNGAQAVTATNKISPAGNVDDTTRLLAKLRAAYEIPADHRVILYAPTWRDDRPGQAELLDLVTLLKLLPGRNTVLLRGHSRTLAFGTQVRHPGVIDVTRHQDISQLYLLADHLITDYSSVMFDYTVTGKPLHFYMPDLEHYRDELRGFTFDPLDQLPGQLAQDVQQLAKQIAETEDDAEARARYAAWRRRFNPLDDGDASRRTLEALEELGYL